MINKTPLDIEAKNAQERARKSRYMLLQISPRKFAIIKENGMSARGINSSNMMYGVKHAKIIPGYEKLDWYEACDVMKKIDLEGFIPDED